jgi:hypothetical protein
MMFSAINFASFRAIALGENWTPCLDDTKSGCTKETGDFTNHPTSPPPAPKKPVVSPPRAAVAPTISAAASWFSCSINYTSQDEAGNALPVRSWTIQLTIVIDVAERTFGEYDAATQAVHNKAAAISATSFVAKFRTSTIYIMEEFNLKTYQYDDIRVLEPPPPLRTVMNTGSGNCQPIAPMPIRKS